MHRIFLLSTICLLGQNFLQNLFPGFLQYHHLVTSELLPSPFHQEKLATVICFLYLFQLHVLLFPQRPHSYAFQVDTVSVWRTLQGSHQHAIASRNPASTGYFVPLCLLLRWTLLSSSICQKLSHPLNVFFHWATVTQLHGEQLFLKNHFPHSSSGTVRIVLSTQLPDPQGRWWGKAGTAQLSMQWWLELDPLS